MTETVASIFDSLKRIYPTSEIQSLTRLILEEVCHLPTHRQILNKDTDLSPTEKEQIRAIVARLRNAEPIQYILGHTEFHGLSFRVNPSVLIPRPETEELVDFILRNHRQAGIRVLDIGTGSGCIAITLAKKLSGSDVTAVDLSEEAIRTAEGNAKRLEAPVHFRQADILQPEATARLFTKPFDLIVSNPPYVLEKEKETIRENVLNYEPHLALFVSDNDPLLFYRAIADLALLCLKPDGFLYFEINAQQGKETCRLLEEKGFREVELLPDLSGKDRFIKAFR